MSAPARRFRLVGQQHRRRFALLRELLEGAGWTETTGDDWDLCWALYRPDPEAPVTPGAGQLFNHFHGVGDLVRKDALAHHLAALRHRLMPRLGADPVWFWPRTFALPDERRALARRVAEEPEALWVTKPVSLSAARGVEITPDPLREPVFERGVAQRHIDDPYLIDGHKFTLKAYLLVRSFDPLEAYVHSWPLVQLAPEPFVPGVPADRRAHITNPSAHPDAAGPAWTWQMLQQRLSEEGRDSAALFSQICEIAFLTLWSARAAIVARDRSTGALPGRHYEVLAIDVLLDAQARPWLLECNFNPSTGPWREDDPRAAVMQPQRRRVNEDLLDRLGLVPIASGRSNGFVPLTVPRLGPDAAAKVAADVSTRAVDEELVVHSRSGERLYHLNESAAVIWHGVAAGLAPAEIAGAVAASGGADAARVEADVRQMTNTWRLMGLVVDTQPPPPVERRLDLGGLSLALRVRVREAQTWVADVTRHLAEAAAPPTATLTVVRRGESLCVEDGEERSWCAGVEEVAPLVHGRLLRLAMARGAHRVALHAACVRIGDRTVLVAGRSGAGKSTLAAAMIGAGHTCVGDEATLIGPGGEATAVPGCLTLEAPSWALLEALLPGLATQAVHRRPDGQRVRYLAPTPGPHPAARPALIVIPSPDPAWAGPPRTTRLSRAAALLALTPGLTPGPGSAGDLEGLIGWLDDVPCHVLSYGDLPSGVAAVEALLA